MMQRIKKKRETYPTGSSTSSTIPPNVSHMLNICRKTNLQLTLHYYHKQKFQKKINLPILILYNESRKEKGKIGTKNIGYAFESSFIEEPFHFGSHVLQNTKKKSPLFNTTPTKEADFWTTDYFAYSNHTLKKEKKKIK